VVRLYGKGLTICLLLGLLLVTSNLRAQDQINPAAFLPTLDSAHFAPGQKQKQGKGRKFLKSLALLFLLFSF